MAVDLFALCDYAKNDGGRLTIVDTFDNIKAEKLPWRAYFGFAIKMHVNFEELNGDELVLKILSKAKPDSPLFCTSAKLSTDRKKGCISIAGNLKGLLFEKVGSHVFKVFLEGQEIFSRDFNVELINKS